MNRTEKRLYVIDTGYGVLVRDRKGELWLGCPGGKVAVFRGLAAANKAAEAQKQLASKTKSILFDGPILVKELETIQ